MSVRANLISVGTHSEGVFLYDEFASHNNSFGDIVPYLKE